MSAQSAIYNPSQTTSAATGDGFSVPRLTTAGRLAITFTTADKGMMVYDTDLNNLFIWNGSAWESVPASGDSSNTQVIFNDNGILAGDAGLTYNKTVQRLTVSGNISIWGGAADDGTNIAVGFNSQADAVVGSATRNTTIGYLAGRYITTATDSIALGYGALQSTFANPMTGGGNVAVGSSALNRVSSGPSNVAVGYNSGLSVTTGGGNIAVGDLAAGNAANAITGSFNIAVGTTSMYSAANISGNDNIGIGRDTFRNLTTGSDSIAIGRNALNAGTNTTGTVSIGTYSGLTLQTGTYNTFVGTSAGARATTSSSCIALGENSYSGTAARAHSGGTNIAIGAAAMYSANDITGASNIAIGLDSTRNLSSGSDNVAIGRLSLNQVTTGAQNVCVGQSAGLRITTATNCVALGNNALSGIADTITGNNNIAIGDAAMYNDGGANVTGTSNVGIGAAAGRRITTGSNNVFAGTFAGFAATAITGSDNIGIGQSTFRNLTSGANNIGIGQQALNAVSTGLGNVAIGLSALSNANANYSVAIGQDALRVSTASDNVAVGTSALNSNTAGSNNTAIGRGALYTNTTSNSITAVGHNSLYLCTGTNNTAIGAFSGNTVTSGTANVLVGTGAGASLTTGASNIGIGVDAPFAAADSRQLVIGSATYYVATNGGAAVYFPNAVTGTVLPPAGSSGFIRLKLNGSIIKVAVYAD